MAQLKTMRKRPGVATTILGDVARRQEVDGFLLQSYAESFAEGDKALDFPRFDGQFILHKLEGHLCPSPSQNELFDIHRNSVGKW